MSNRPESPLDRAIAYEIKLREDFRETIRTLSPTRQAEAWAIVNELVALAKEYIKGEP